MEDGGYLLIWPCTMCTRVAARQVTFFPPLSLKGCTIPRELVLHKVFSEKNSRLCTKTEVVFLNGAGIFKVANTAQPLNQICIKQLLPPGNLTTKLTHSMFFVGCTLNIKVICWF